MEILRERVQNVRGARSRSRSRISMISMRVCRNRRKGEGEKKERKGRRASRQVCNISRARERASVRSSANGDPSSNGVRPMVASDCAPANARHCHRRMRPILVNGGVETESAVRATRSSAFSFVEARSRIRLCFASVLNPYKFYPSGA